MVFFGGAEGDRTPDLRIANAALSQLSYCPEEWPRILCMAARESTTIPRPLHFCAKHREISLFSPRDSLTLPSWFPEMAPSDSLNEVSSARSKVAARLARSNLLTEPSRLTEAALLGAT